MLGFVGITLTVSMIYSLSALFNLWPLRYLRTVQFKLQKALIQPPELCLLSLDPLFPWLT